MNSSGVAMWNMTTQYVFIPADNSSMKKILFETRSGNITMADLKTLKQWPWKTSDLMPMKRKKKKPIMIDDCERNLKEKIVLCEKLGLSWRKQPNTSEEGGPVEEWKAWLKMKENMKTSRTEDWVWPQLSGRRIWLLILLYVLIEEKETLIYFNDDL